MEYKLSDTAKYNIKNILDYYYEYDMNTMQKYARIFSDSFERITELPYIWIVDKNNSDIRIWNIPNAPYSIPYLIQDNTIYILRVFQQYQNPLDSWD